MQKGTRSFAEGNTDGLSGGVDMPQGTVPTAAGAATIELSLDRGHYEGSPNRGHSLTDLGFQGYLGPLTGTGVRWAPSMQ